MSVQYYESYLPEGTRTTVSYESEEDAKFHAVIAADIEELKLLYIEYNIRTARDLRDNGITRKVIVGKAIDNVQERIKQHARFFARSQAGKVTKGGQV